MDGPNDLIGWWFWYVCNTLYHQERVLSIFVCFLAPVQHHRLQKAKIRIAKQSLVDNKLPFATFQKFPDSSRMSSKRLVPLQQGKICVSKISLKDLSSAKCCKCAAITESIVIANLQCKAGHPARATAHSTLFSWPQKLPKSGQEAQFPGFGHYIWGLVFRLRAKLQGTTSPICSGQYLNR